jgi:hypothetical protein
MSTATDKLVDVMGTVVVLKAMDNMVNNSYPQTRRRRTTKRVSRRRRLL